MKISIGNKQVGWGQKSFIIAEAGSNHDQNLQQAKKLIDIASESGADSIKFQLFKAEVLNPVKDKIFDIIKKCEFPREWLKELIQYAKAKDIIFLATPFDIEAVDILDEAGIPAFKIASSEVTNFSFLRYVALKKKPVILSTGMSDLADVDDAVRVIREAGNEAIILLQCSALYPTPHDKVHLKVMDTLKEAFRVPVGFSDHTLGILFPAIAVARGASVIEKHFTSDKNLPGPDHSYAIEPAELAQMVKDIRAVEAGLGSPEKIFLPEERRQTRRKSLFAAKDLKPGDILKMEDLNINRPATGLPLRFLNVVLGQQITKSVKKDEPLSWEVLGGK